MSCGVCGRMETLSCATLVDTVADGFSSDDLYAGPKCWLGARSRPSLSATLAGMLRIVRSRGRLLNVSISMSFVGAARLGAKATVMIYARMRDQD